MAMTPENASRREATPAEGSAAPRRASWLFAYPVAWVVLAISLAASSGGWFIAHKHQDLSAQKQFDEEASRIQTTLSERMSVYQDVLRGGAGLFAASFSVERGEWKTYVETVSVNKRFPGMAWLGFVADVPGDQLNSFIQSTRADGASDFQLRNPGTNEDLFIVKYIEPQAEQRSMLGVDLGAEPSCRAIAQQAQDTGQTFISDRLELTGADQKKHDGLIMLTPVYRNGQTASTPEERHANIAGWVFAGFITDQLMNSILGDRVHMLHFQVFEQNGPGSESLIFDSDTGTNKLSGHYQSRFASVDTLAVGRRLWVLRFNSRPGFDAGIPRFPEHFVAIGGVLISLLLSGVVLALSATRARALIMATDMTTAFRDANTRLEKEIGEREHAERRIAAQYAVSRVLAEAQTLPEATPRIIQAICESLNWDFGAVWQIDPAIGQLHCVEVWVRPGLELGEFKTVAQATTFKRGDGLPGRVWAGGKPVWISDVVKDSNFPRKLSAQKAGLHGALGFPVLAGDKVMGVMEFFSHRIDEPDAEMLDMMTATGSQIGQFMDRKLSEEALDRERYLMTTLMDNLPDRIYFKDVRSRFIRNNRAHLEKFGLDDPAKALGKSDFDFFTEEHARQAFDDEQQIIRTGQPMTKEEKETHPGGGITWALSTKMPMRDESGQIVGTFGISRDITARRRAEDALREAKDAAEEASRAKSQFLASMSHELRTPLNSVIGFANILFKNKNGHLDAGELTFLDRIIANGKHLLSLINEILDLSKIEARKLELQIAPVDLGVLVRETVAQQESLVREKPVQLLADLPPLIALMPTDAEKLKQVIINLIGNALKFTERGSVTVRVAIDPVDHHPLHIDVVDTGIGIPQDKLGVIFEAFQQAEAGTTRKYGGTGLGLTISQALCHLMGYHITVSSELGRGSTFSVVLKPTPEVPAGVASVTAAVPVAPAATGGPATLAGRRILVIDDELDSRTLLSHLITDCGCQVVSASSGAQGLQMAREFKPDLITLDLMMPSMDGWQVVRAIKADPQLSNIPVVVVSVVGSENRGHILGAVDVLQKPVSREDLATVLQRNIHVSARRVMIVDDDPDARQIMLNTLQEKAVEVRTASNGREALTLLEQFPPDLILLDLMMPVMDGITFLDALRRDPRFQLLPVVVITARILTPPEIERLKAEKLRVLNKAEAFNGSLRRLIEDLLLNGKPQSQSVPK